MAQSYKQLLDAGFKPKHDFRIETGNLHQKDGCLLVAPRGGGIEWGTSQIVQATANVAGRAFYIFNGIRSQKNFDLHIDSTGFDEPKFLKLVAQSSFVLSVHGKQNSVAKIIYVGGLYREGKRLAIEYLGNDLKDLGIKVLDAVGAKGAEHITAV